MERKFNLVLLVLCRNELNCQSCYFGFSCFEPALFVTALIINVSIHL